MPSLRSLLLHTLAWGPAALLALGCSGMIGPSGREAAQDAADEAERARLRGDFDGAEAILKRRLAATPNDARSWRLLGDVNLTRGQHFGQRWKENLGWAIDAYTTSLRHDPASCATWGRLAASVVSAAENETTAVPRERLDALPLKRGWTACPGAALLSLELHRQPTAAELAAVSLPAAASDTDRTVAAAPWMRSAVERVELGPIDWQPLLPPRPPVADSPFVVLKIPSTGGSVSGSDPRRFDHPEWVLVSKVEGSRFTYLDRRYSAVVPEKALTRAPGCPGTRWTLEGTDRIPVGRCVAGPQDRRASDLYDPDILRPTGVAHFHEPSIDRARIPWSTVSDKPIRCLGGEVGRQFYDTPSCVVAYDRAVPVTRSLPGDSGLGALSEAHAEQIVHAARSGALFGEEVAAHLARGEAGVGLPYDLYVLAQPDLTGCKGRGVFTKLAIEDGALTFYCTANGTRYQFRELVLTATEPAEGE